MNADFEVYVDDEFMAGTSGPQEQAFMEAVNYALQYAEEGTVTIYLVTRTKMPFEVKTGTLVTTGGGQMEMRGVL